MKAFIDKILAATNQYNVWDFAILKICLVALGVLVGTYFANFFFTYISFLWAVFIVSYLWIMYKTFFKYLK